MKSNKIKKKFLNALDSFIVSAVKLERVEGKNGGPCELSRAYRKKAKKRLKKSLKKL